MRKLLTVLVGGAVTLTLGLAGVSSAESFQPQDKHAPADAPPPGSSPDAKPAPDDKSAPDSKPAPARDERKPKGEWAGERSEPPKGEWAGDANAPAKPAGPAEPVGTN